MLTQGHRAQRHGGPALQGWGRRGLGQGAGRRRTGGQPGPPPMARWGPCCEAPPATEKRGGCQGRDWGTGIPAAEQIMAVKMEMDSGLGQAGVGGWEQAGQGNGQGSWGGGVVLSQCTVSVRTPAVGLACLLTQNPSGMG